MNEYRQQNDQATALQPLNSPGLLAGPERNDLNPVVAPKRIVNAGAVPCQPNLPGRGRQPVESATVTGQEASQRVIGNSLWRNVAAAETFFEGGQHVAQRIGLGKDARGCVSLALLGSDIVCYFGCFVSAGGMRRGKRGNREKEKV